MRGLPGHWVEQSISRALAQFGAFSSLAELLSCCNIATALSHLSFPAPSHSPDLFHFFFPAMLCGQDRSSSTAQILFPPCGQLALLGLRSCLKLQVVFHLGGMKTCLPSPASCRGR